MASVLILGGYGNFGKRIAAALAASGIPVMIAGRSGQKARALAEELQRRYPDADVEITAFDIARGLADILESLKPAVVVHTCGPFQQQRYTVAEACIRAKAHYIDLADARRFVTGIGTLDAVAQAAGVWVISGASTVPVLSSAVVEHFAPEFSRIASLDFGIAPGQRTERGLATAQAILSYVGRPMAPISGEEKTRYGWQDLHRQEYPGIGPRWLANCDIPDLDLLPVRYGIERIRFGAGLENRIAHFGLWGLSWLVRFGLPLRPERYAGMLLRAAQVFDRFGSTDGGMHVNISGTGVDGRALTRRWFLIARNGDGPHIPAVPAAVLARKLALGQMPGSGAAPCIGLISLSEYLAELKPYAIETLSA